MALVTAGGGDYIRTKGNEVKVLALRLDLNEEAPEVMVVGRGLRIQRRTMLLRDTPYALPTYVKRDVNFWEYLGNYRAANFRTDWTTIEQRLG